MMFSGRYPRKALNHFPIQGVGGSGRKPMLSATVFPSVQSPSRAAAGTTYFCNEAINRILGKDLGHVPLTPSRVFSFHTNPPTWSYGEKPPSPDSTSAVQKMPAKPEDMSPPPNLGTKSTHLKFCQFFN